MIASLDKHANNVSPLGQTPGRNKARRHALRRTAGRLMPQERVAACGQKSTMGAVSIHAVNGQHHYGGLETCGSVWMCPVCAAKITEGRKEDIQAILDAHHLSGGKAYMATLTMPHNRFQTARELNTAVTNCWRYVKSGEPWKRAKLNYGYLGDIRALEVTHGDGNGWHPHLHILVLLKPGVSQAKMEAFAAFLFDRWKAGMSRRGYGNCSIDAFTFKEVTPGTGAADYVSKWGAAALELTKAHIKSAKGSSRTPWQILEGCHQGCKRDGALFREFANAFKGKRQLTWSRGIREHYGLRQEPSDHELSEEPTIQETHVATIDRLLWKEISRRGLTAFPLIAMDGENSIENLNAYLTSKGISFEVEMHMSMEEGRLVPLYRKPSKFSNTRGHPRTGPGGNSGNSPIPIETYERPTPGSGGDLSDIYRCDIYRKDD